ncbi:MAG: serine hydrolase [Lachnospiraceae bacterium]|nr:serine hydrolase [Lachnospiraceae bacterium]
MWKAYLADIGPLSEPSVYKRLSEAMTPQRAAKVSKLKSRRDRFLAVGADALLSTALTRYLSGKLFEKNEGRVTAVDLSAIETVTFAAKEYRKTARKKGGKPFLKAFPDFHYNLSHSGTKVLLAVSDREIGCDIQKVSGHHERVMKRFFTEPEQAYVTGVTEDGRAERFTEIWARKESFVKATGRGLAEDFRSFTVSDADGIPMLSKSPESAEWELVAGEFPEGYRGCICVKKERSREHVKKKENTDFKKMKAYVDSLAKTYGLPTADVMIMKNHQVLFRHMFGSEDLEGKTPVSGLSRYLVFSMTKIQTMTAVMQLVEQGKLSLQDEVSKYLPAYGKLYVAEEKEGTIRIVPAKRPMLVWHLLSMQSGLDYDLNRPGILLARKKYGEKATTRQIVDSFPETPLCFHPGDRFLYSLSHDVAAAIVEVVSGMKFSDYLRKNIWNPLGMKHTGFFKRHDARKNLVQQYVYENEKIVPMENDCSYRLSDAYESGGAGLSSTTEDYAVLADALACGGTAANGKQILKPETIEIIKTDLLTDQGRKDMHDNMGRFEYGYGCGMQVLLNPELVGTPAPAGVFGWDGAAGSCCIMDRSTGLSLVFMMHVRNFGPAYGEIHPKLRDLLFE